MNDFYCDEVLSGRTPVVVVRESADVLAFEHTRPHYTAAHVVVIPKRHIMSFIETTQDEADIVARVWAMARDIAAEINAAHGGAHVVTNVGKYQESKHFHIHVGAN